MYRWLFALILTCATTFQFAQTSSSNFQPATIKAVATHQNAPGAQDNGAVRYDVSVQVGNVVYVVLYTPPNGANTVEYTTGMNLLVLVGSKTLTFNSAITGPTEVPIQRRETLPAEKTINPSMAPSQYFGMKLQNLTEKLNLTEDQQAKIRPTLEQEAGEVGQILLNGAMSSKDKMNRFVQIVRASDEKITPVLTPDQLQKFQALRKEQKQDLKQKLKQALSDQKTGQQS